MPSSSRRRASNRTEHPGGTVSRLLAFVLALCATAAFAQPFPSKPIRIIVPFPAGATTDIIARLVGQRLQETMGQPVLGENRGGAGGSHGAAAVAEGAPHGSPIPRHTATPP